METSKFILITDQTWNNGFNINLLTYNEGRISEHDQLWVTGDRVDMHSLQPRDPIAISCVNTKCHYCASHVLFDWVTGFYLTQNEQYFRYIHEKKPNGTVAVSC